MSLTELKHAVESLSAEERQELSAHLWWCEHRSDPTWRAEMSRRLDQSIQGQGHSQQDLEQLLARLKSEGR